MNDERTAEQLGLAGLNADDEGFRLVYQGGHHDVFCNGTEHRVRGGGFCGIAPKITTAQYKCNCALFTNQPLNK